MKKWFSQPLFYLWEQYHEQTRRTPEMDVDTFCALNKRNITYIEENSQASWGYEMFHADATGEMVHIFLNDENLKGFLETTKLANLEGINRFLVEHGNKKTVAYIKTKETSSLIIYCFGLHIPYENRKEGYAFNVAVNADNGTVELSCLKGTKIYGLNDSHYEALLDKSDETSKDFCRVFRLGLNLLAYMNCFPNCVSDGVPKITVDNGESRLKKTITVFTSEKVLESDEKGFKIPHFRRGYWKYCSSDFYKEAKGQMIFVSETMVKGRAKTVEKTKDLSSFK